MVTRSPAFQFYPKDWLDFKVQRMSYEAQGVYIKLLCFMWSDSEDQCSINYNERLIARALGLKTAQCRKVFDEFFTESDPLLEKNGSKIFSKRLKKEAERQKKFRELQSEKGKKSAELRANQKENESTTVQPMPVSTESNSSSLSLSSSSTTKDKEILRILRISFNSFWQSYPKKKSKGQAEKTWNKIKPDEQLLAIIIAKIEQAKTSEQWQNPQYIPYPSTWLNAKGWEDEIVQHSTKKKSFDPDQGIVQRKKPQDGMCEACHKNPEGQDALPCQQCFDVNEKWGLYWNKKKKMFEADERKRALMGWAPPKKKEKALD